MNASDLYSEEDMTFEELEEFTHEPSLEEIPTYTPNMKKWLLSMMDFACPDAEEKEEFMLRKPGLNATKELLDETRSHYQILPPVQQRMLFKHLRSKMLRQLIPCPGADTIDKLLDILQAEIDSGAPSRVPEWYEFSNRKFGPRAMGFEKCENRGCFNTDTVTVKLDRCGKCKLAFYCSRECQVADWKARHKKVCSKGAEFRDKTKRASQFLNMFTQMHERR